MAKSKYYAVARGRTPGIYESWLEANEQVNGFSGANVESFNTKEEAKKYMKRREQKMEANTIRAATADAGGATIVESVESQLNNMAITTSSCSVEDMASPEHSKLSKAKPEIQSYYAVVRAHSTEIVTSSKDVQQLREENNEFISHPYPTYAEAKAFLDGFDTATKIKKRVVPDATTIIPPSPPPNEQEEKGQPDTHQVGGNKIKNLIQSSKQYYSHRMQKTK